ncbi:amidohydrolase [Pseudonocardia spinosispora]|uniref:amidohydrolase n=1 Tax=Pseudonocardia spinosispora TaxID=103441 RepID=UPI0004267DE8|nr:amidohydrolase [Pseudonocardia spinosispora]
MRPRIFRAARIASPGDPDLPAFATLGDRIVATGDPADLRSAFADAEVIDLDGALVVPGFNDSHCHPSVTSESRLRVDVSHRAAPDLASVRRILTDRVSATPAGDWVFASGYHPTLSGTGGRLDRAVLDDISTEHPIAVVLFNWHCVVANSRALELSGLTDDSTAPVGGDIGRDGAGRLDGWLYEQAFLEPYWAGSGQQPWVPDLSIDALVDALVEENRYLHSTGITSYCDAIVTPRIWRTYQAARDAGRLTPRVGMLLWSTYFDTARDLGIGAGFGDDRLRMVGTKLMYDGALFSGTCLCRHPYDSSTDGENGIQLVDRRDFAGLVAEIHAEGGRVAVHANGDRAVSEVLDAIEAAQAAAPGAGVNHRIEHCSMVDETLLKRIHRAGVTPVPFGGAIRQHGEQLVRIYGEQRAAHIVSHRAFLDAGITVGGSSDYPTTPVEPLFAIQSMTTRALPDGRTIGPEQRVSVAEALQMYTVGSAHACGEDGRKGRLRPGQLADFVALDTDILAGDPSSIAGGGVLSTWVGADQVWHA